LVQVVDNQFYDGDGNLLADITGLAGGGGAQGPQGPGGVPAILNGTFISSLPEILIYNNNNISLKNNAINTFIGYKYYTDTRDIHISSNLNIKILNFNGIHNLKPDIQYLGFNTNTIIKYTIN
jgi:hypothetical protein